MLLLYDPTHFHSTLRLVRLRGWPRTGEGDLVLLRDDVRIAQRGHQRLWLCRLKVNYPALALNFSVLYETAVEYIDCSTIRKSEVEIETHLHFLLPLGHSHGPASRIVLSEIR